MPKAITVIRVLAYSGPEEDIREHLSKRWVKGTKVFGLGNQLRIDESILGDLHFENIYLAQEGEVDSD